MKTILKTSAVATLFAPLLVSAEYFGAIKLMIHDAGGIIKYLTVVVAGIALLIFFVGLVKFIFKAGGEDGVKEGKSLMIWGTIALFVMVSIWGIVTFLQQQFGIQPGTAPNIPTINL